MTVYGNTQKSVIAKSNPAVVSELKKMGILPQSESSADYPKIGQDPTWESLYQHPTVEAKKAAVAKCLKAGKTKLANVVAKFPVIAAIKWVKKDEDIYGATVALKWRDMRGKLHTSKEMLRIDGRRGTFRVDLGEMTGWTAIDAPTRGKGYPDLKSAQKFAEQWVKEANKQETLSPRVK